MLEPSRQALNQLPVEDARSILMTVCSATAWVDASTIGGDNDWTVSANDMYPTTATNIGIGTTSPIYKHQAFLLLSFDLFSNHLIV